MTILMREYGKSEGDRDDEMMRGRWVLWHVCVGGCAIVCVRANVTECEIDLIITIMLMRQYAESGG